MRKSILLAVRAERDLLRELTAEELSSGASAGFFEMSPPGWIPREILAPEIGDRLWGASRPSAFALEEGRGVDELLIARVEDVFFAPLHGVLFDQQGRVFQATAGEVLSHSSLASLPFVHQRKGAPNFSLRADIPQLLGASVFLPRGGRANYGHFLLDGLTSLLALYENGLCHEFPPLAAPLRGWQRQLLSLALPELRVSTTLAPMVRLREAAFATSMDHFLHHPTDIILRLRQRILAHSPRGDGSAKRIYFSRRNQPFRAMINEEELEAALRRRGFVIALPEKMSVHEQIELARGADIIVAASGAALANVLFARPGCKVFEIQPINFTSKWVLTLCYWLRLEWHGFFCNSPLPNEAVPMRRRMRRHFNYGYQLPLESFLEALGQMIQCQSTVSSG